ncbi:hypothetical protein BgiBS90_028185 [Biomphalaria glabrata]|nr:hypothetical protein BgiBS90_028185 [Biomphalaria glabrata]
MNSTVLTNSTAGKHETQISESGESDLHKHLANCKKNPGHTQFIPFTHFTITDLPEDSRDVDLYELIKATADLTVRIGVNKVSPDRPEFWPNTQFNYPFYEIRGSNILRTGSGLITVYKFVDGSGYDGHESNYHVLTGKKLERNYKTCPCDKCQQSEKPSKIWWEILIHTATHVVFDDTEASHTTCRLFYDDKDSPVVILDKVSVDYVNIERDKCRLKYVVCDKTLGDKLYNMVKLWCELLKKVWKKYINRSELMFIVSHPHGCFKQVSVGRLVDNNKVSDYNSNYNLTTLTYTASTCPGSSGAPVYCVGLGATHVHCGTLDLKVNYSGVGYYMKQTTL